MKTKSYTERIAMSPPFMAPFLVNEALEECSNRVTKLVQSFDPADLPFLVASMEMGAAALKAQFPKSFLAVVEELKKNSITLLGTETKK